MSSIEPALNDGLLELGRRVEFAHPLVRSAAYRSARAEDRHRVHRALAEATDPERADRGPGIARAERRRPTRRSPPNSERSAARTRRAAVSPRRPLSSARSRADRGPCAAFGASAGRGPRELPGGVVRCSAFAPRHCGGGPAGRVPERADGSPARPDCLRLGSSQRCAPLLLGRRGGSSGSIWNSHARPTWQPGAPQRSPGRPAGRRPAGDLPRHPRPPRPPGSALT